MALKHETDILEMSREHDMKMSEKQKSYKEEKDRERVELLNTVNESHAGDISQLMSKHEADMVEASRVSEGCFTSILPTYLMTHVAYTFADYQFIIFVSYLTT